MLIPCYKITQSDNVPVAFHYQLLHSVHFELYKFWFSLGAKLRTNQSLSNFYSTNQQKIYASNDIIYSYLRYIYLTYFPSKLSNALCSLHEFIQNKLMLTKKVLWTRFEHLLLPVTLEQFKGLPLQNAPSPLIDEYIWS